MRTRTALWFPLGVVCGAIGLLPWLVHGGGLPLQNLWAGTDPTDMPFVLLPFSQYAVSTIAALLVIGGAIGGLACRVLPGPTGRRRALLLLGVLLVQAVAIAQTAAVVGGGLQRRQEAVVYLALLVAGSIVAAVLGASVLLLISSKARAAVVVGAALSAALVSSWADALISSPTALYSGPLWPFSVLMWVAPIVVGIAVAWSGVGTVGRALAAVFAALTLWVGPALITAIVNSVGTRVYARYPAEMARAGVQVLIMALGSPELVLPPLLVAAAIAVVGIVVGGRAARGRRPEADRVG